MDSLTDDKKGLGELMVTLDWHLELIELNQNSNFLSKFTKLTEDLPHFSEEPEKRPVNEIYFEKHPSISTEYNISNGVNQENFKIKSVILRVFEHGAITAQCRYEAQDHSKRTVIEVVEEFNDLRDQARTVMYDALTDFVDFIDKTYDDIEFTIPPGERGVRNLERYEYIDTDLSDASTTNNISISEMVRKDGNVQQLRELVGFLRMSREYAWPNLSPEFCRSYMRDELGNREDELWFVNPQRFIRYFPDRDIPENVDFIEDIVLAIEVLLSLRSVHKALLEDVRKEVGHLPNTLTENNGTLTESRTSAHEIDSDDIEKIQAQISIVSFRLARTHFPPNIRFYAQYPFAIKIFRKIEEELQLPELSTALETEMEKFRGAVDSFGTIITHRRGMKLQRRILILTVVVGVAGALVGLGNLVASYI